MSGNLEVLDFDHIDAYPQWRNTLDHALQSVVDMLPLIETPKGGRHLYYRCDEIEGNQVLAQHQDGDKVKVYIETRSQGGMVVACGSPLAVHPLQKPYRLLSGNPLRIPLITTEQRATLSSVARSLNRYEKPRLASCPSHPLRKPRTAKGNRPSDKFNASAEWEDILNPMGWEVERTHGDTTYWRKPDSRRGSHHATTGYQGKDVFFCFSTESPPFQAGKRYTKFSAYALLYHKNDWKMASRTIQTNGLTGGI
jgi:hypothetical protein